MATFSNKLNVYGLFPRPKLVVSLLDDTVVLSWPTNTFGSFTLQSNTNLVGTDWQTITNAVVVSNGINQVTTPATGAAAFYRLKK
jgi:hypothetical protein